MSVPSTTAATPYGPTEFPDPAWLFGYRPVLDGVRAVAVLSVLAYHLGLSRLPGGFLGVDIFFVLSGYLITSLLVTEYLRHGRISLLGFWTRRARRLGPALLLMIVAVAIGVRLLRPVTEWSGRASDVIWTLFYAANWHQIGTSQDYFAQWDSVSPLRHMWSIAIEEQFYLVWPIAMLFGLRPTFRRWLLPVVVGAALASTLAMAFVFDPANPTRAYVGTDARAQELLVGAALAIVLRLRGARVRSGGTATTSIGITCAILLAATIGLLTDSSPLYYRGGALAISTAAALMLWSIETAPGSLLARLLSVPPFPWLGRISYGLYLWHWPAILFTPTLLVLLFGARGLMLAQNRLSGRLVAVLVAVTCTVTSYYLVERPIRHGRMSTLLRPRRVAVAAALAFTVTFFVVRSTLAVPQSLLAQVQQAGTECGTKFDSLEVPTCLVVNAGPGRPVLAVMGDSVAKSMHPAFAKLAQQHRWTFLAAAHDRCTVVIRRIDFGTVASWGTCMNAISVIQREVLARRPALIVVNDNWLPVTSFDANGVQLTRNSPGHIADIERRMTDLMPQLTAGGALVVLMRYTPESAVIGCLDPLMAATARCSAPGISPRFDQYNQMLDRVAWRFPDRVRTIDLTDVVCPNNHCVPRVDGLILRYDSLHYSAAGSDWLVPHLARKLAAAGIKLDL